MYIDPVSQSVHIFYIAQYQRLVRLETGAIYTITPSLNIDFLSDKLLADGGQQRRAECSKPRSIL